MRLCVAVWQFFWKWKLYEDQFHNLHTCSNSTNTNTLLEKHHLCGASLGFKHWVFEDEHSKLRNRKTFHLRKCTLSKNWEWDPSSYLKQFGKDCFWLAMKDKKTSASSAQTEVKILQTLQEKSHAWVAHSVCTLKERKSPHIRYIMLNFLLVTISWNQQAPYLMISWMCSLSAKFIKWKIVTQNV